MKQNELHIKEEKPTTVECNRVKRVNHLGHEVKCYGIVFLHPSLDPNLLVGKCSTCEFIQTQKRGAL